MRQLLVVAALAAACQSGSESAPAPGSAAESAPAPGSAAESGSAPASVSREDCAAILDKADKLIGHDSTTHPRDPAKRELEINECVANATPAMLECAKAATSYQQLRACEKR